MTLRFGLRRSKDLLQKVIAEGKMMGKEVTSYTLFNFVMSAYHLCEWIENDPSMPKTAKQNVATVRADRNIAICRDLTNTTKHFKLERKYKNQTVSDTTSSRGFGVGRFGRGGLGVGEESIEIDLLDGSTIGVLNLKNNVIAIWEAFFQSHGI